MSITESQEWHKDDPSDPFQFSGHYSFPPESDLKEKKEKNLISTLSILVWLG